MSLEQIRYTAAEVLAAAVLELFPDVELVDGSTTYSGFYYDFFFPHSIHPELHLQIEEKMRQICRENREVREIEMVSISAKEFLKSRGRSEKASECEGPGLFSLVEIGEFVDLAKGPVVQSTSELKYFKLFPPIVLEDQRIRFLGTAFSSKDELKDFLKKWNAYPKKRHEKIGEVKGFWSEVQGQRVWLPPGLKKLEELISLFKNFPESLEIRSPNKLKKKELLRDLKADTICEVFFREETIDGIEDVGFLNPGQRSEVQVTTFLKNLTSSLQYIEQTLKMLGFDYSVYLSRSKKGTRGEGILEKTLSQLRKDYRVLEEKSSLSKLEFMVLDGLRRPWSAVSVYVGEYVTVQVIIERNLSLLLYQGVRNRNTGT